MNLHKLFTASAVLLLVTSCGGVSLPLPLDQATAPAGLTPGALRAARAELDSGQSFNPTGPPVSEAKTAPGADLSTVPGVSTQEAAQTGEPRQRQQIKNGSLQLEVDNLKEAETALSARVEALGGFVETVSLGEAWGHLTLRLPSADFDSFVEGAGSLGRVRQLEIGVQDVTAQFYDLKTRLDNQRLLLAEYRELLRRSARLEEILDVMARITEVTTQIESVEGQLRYLSRQIDFSTLQVSLSLPVLAGGRPWPDLGESFAEFGRGTVDFAVGLLFFLLGLAVYGPPVVALVFLLVWLWIGRPGLWRRLRGLAFKGKGPNSAAPPA